VTAEPLRVVIADDHPFYREGLARLLGQSGIDVIADVPNGEAAIQAVLESAPDVVVMDLNMPGVSGLEATQRLADEAPATRVLILSVSAQESDVIDAILAGASGYLLKDGPVEEVVSGINAAAAGQSLVSPRIATVLLQRARAGAGPGEDPGAVQLSGREHEILTLLAEGKTSHEISEALVVSSGSVRSLIASILTKLQTDTRQQQAARETRNRPR
jgi:DNA-binding NarL/FixJ family response regulator